MLKQLDRARLAVVVAAFSLAAQPAFAQDLESGINNLATSITNIIRGVLLIIAVIFWSLVGYKFFNNAPDAKQSLQNAIIGTVLLVIGGAIVTFVKSSFGQ